MNTQLYKFLNNKFKCKNNNVICLSKMNVDNINTIEDKYNILKNIFYSSSFLPNEVIEDTLNILNKIHKVYFALIKFYNILIKNKIIKYHNEHDINMNDLSSLSKKCKINIIENYTEYEFRISDLINIINTSLSYHYQFFPNPKDIKNPYTNHPFSLHNLYNIYYKIKESNYKIPILFTYYYNNNFNLQEFTINHENEINEYITNSYTKSLDNDELFNEISKMIKKKNKELGIYFVIDSSFPKDKIIEVYKPYYEYYIISKYAIHLFKQSHYDNILNKKLLAFYKINRYFGRRKIIFTNTTILKNNKYVNKTIKQNIFRDYYIPFHKIDVKLKQRSCYIFNDFDDDDYSEYSNSEYSNSDSPNSDSLNSESSNNNLNDNSTHIEDIDLTQTIISNVFINE